ncbi:cytochrome c oxidase accessory protein CcoG [Derxia gummosa]|uniref:Cytochrome c oxidase accessory protein CcoG n=1 Tax=Derxia gummosa DSM 723 TaxID=1121388 RepID=A0A8B6XBT9_9BURK|nr:cytochrome c oxidase accessory protein CcoG [Derxia gummosa]
MGSESKQQGVSSSDAAVNSSKEAASQPQAASFALKGTSEKSAAGTDVKDDGRSLYQKRIKIYPRAIKNGWFDRWRWALVWFTQIIFYGTAWLQWNDRQAVLFHLTERKFYIFGFVLWPQDFIYLTGLLIISAYALFLFTAIAGRLFCGYACPQTVYTEIFTWVERLIEGDRHKRMRLDESPWDGRKIGLRLAKFSIWAVIGLWTGFTFVGYFTPIRELLSEVVHLDVSGWSLFWMLFYAGFTILQAGFMREQVCKYMCPYARFQSSMFDRDTLVVTYDAARGDPRGSRPRKLDHRSQGFGDCVDCGVCVQVCPTGIDIRNGLQYECIGCGACIDGCDDIMEKMNYPRGLIRYTTENALEGKYPDKHVVKHILRPRTLIYTVVLFVIVGAWIGTLINRNPLKVDVIRDRGVLAREIEGGEIANVYQLKIMNTDEAPHRYRVMVNGIPGIHVQGAQLIEVEAITTRAVAIEVAAPMGSGERGSNKVEFVVESLESPVQSTSEKSVFYLP